MFNLKVMKKN